MLFKNSIKKYEENTEEEKIMYCRHCGTELDDTMKFCPVCGNAVEKIEKIAKEKSAVDEQPIVDKSLNLDKSKLVKEQQVEESPKASSGGNKALKGVLIGVIALALIAGGIVGVKMNRDKAYMNDFATYLDSYKKLQDDYIVSAFQEQYEGYLNEAQACIDEKKKEQVETLRTNMENLKGDIISSNEKVKKYQEIYDKLDDRFTGYIMDSVAKSELEDYTTKLVNGIKSADASTCEEVSNSLDKFEKEVLDASLIVVSNDKAELENVDDSIFLYDVEREELNRKLKSANKLVEEKIMQKQKKNTKIVRKFLK